MEHPRGEQQNNIIIGLKLVGWEAAELDLLRGILKKMKNIEKMKNFSGPH